MRELGRVQVFRLIIVTSCIAGCCDSCRRDKWAAFIERRIDQHESPAWISSVSMDGQDGGKQLMFLSVPFFFSVFFFSEEWCTSQQAF